MGATIDIHPHLPALELRFTRNKWAHPGTLDTTENDAWRAPDTMARLVEKIDVEAAGRLRSLVQTVRHGQRETPATVSGAMTEKSVGAGRATRNRVNLGVMPSAEDFKEELRIQLSNVEKGKHYIDVKSGDLRQKSGVILSPIIKFPCAAM